MIGLIGMSDCSDIIDVIDIKNKKRFLILGQRLQTGNLSL